MPSPGADAEADRVIDNFMSSRGYAGYERQNLAKRFDRITISERPEEDSSLSVDEQINQQPLRDSGPLDKKRE